jgi:hypothetical protein
MAIDDPRYKTVNDLHSLGYPAITRHEAEAALKVLYREFGKLEDACATRTVPMGKSLDIRQFVRRCWIALKPTTGNNRGWGRLIHDVGHRVYRFRHPGQRPHGPGEEVIETHIAYYIRHQTDWLTGSLKETPKQKTHKVPILEARLARWQAKAKRANTAIKKLNRQIKYYTRKVEVANG